MTDELSTRVRRGVRLLDREKPGWERKIDLDRLDLGHTCNCVLGQVYGNYDRALYELDGDVAERPENFGFDDDNLLYRTLTDRWRGFIRRRLARKKAA
jgi:hypothetical protein